MTKPVITTHQELMQEKARLKARLRQHKTQLRYSVEEIKDTLNPISQIAKTTKKIWNADSSNPLIAMGVTKLTDLVIRKGILRKAGWLSRLVAPVLVQKIATYLVSEKAADRIGQLLHKTASRMRDERPARNKEK
ncbi:hypothetical protein [Niabella drilacis]|uniref:Uncharacterized protein n=1 Tax=Niabella drilacis (strain DSM 25811 / CCM 8410 / CCUG 62505 / LMG 26954 / E90) TaxID=1285928 RepID=A0A1G6UK60_NIADE|nr:hypothetical protein [Niabella drilacis]SDD41810.1 hypothetical protein SAMN04487894_10912 [Niabella drilacis]